MVPECASQVPDTTVAPVRKPWSQQVVRSERPGLFERKDPGL